MDRDESGLSGDPPDSQHQPPLLLLKILFYYDGENAPTGKTLWQNKAVDLKTMLGYRWTHQNRAFAREFPAPPIFSDTTFQTHDLSCRHTSQFVAQQRFNADSRTQNSNLPFSRQQQF